ncbi:MAG: hypothetical protein K6B41_01490 [Butyrivibrio sp.]|nr:hypothetical protein [Butyrivibrio sp.]
MGQKKGHPLIILVVIGTVLSTIISICGKNGIYAGYNYDFKSAPVLSLMFRGFSEGKMPWEILTMGINEGQNDAVENSISGNGISGNSVSGNSVSDNSILDIEQGLDESTIADSSSEADSSDLISTYSLESVDADYFNDALFIGDSRTVGLSEYCEELDQRATFYAKVSLTIYKVLDTPLVETEEGDDITIDEALQQNQFGKIYIMIGLNEIGTGNTEYFAEAYQKVINRIRELQPEAIIYIQGIMHVTADKSNSDEYVNNDNINERNEAISQIADNINIFYLDMNSSVDDENGDLIKDLSFDDIHLKAPAYERWYNYLKENGIKK